MTRTEVRLIKALLSLAEFVTECKAFTAQERRDSEPTEVTPQETVNVVFNELQMALDDIDEILQEEKE